MQAFELVKEAEKRKKGKEKIVNIPNAMTLLRVVFTILYARSYYFWQITQVFMFLSAAALTDLADGFLARRLGQCTEFGRLFDAVADRLLLVAILGNVVVVGLADKSLGFDTERDWALISAVIFLEGAIMLLLNFSYKINPDLSVYRFYGKARQVGHILIGISMVLKLVSLHLTVAVAFACSLLAAYGAWLQHLKALLSARK